MVVSNIIPSTIIERLPELTIPFLGELSSPAESLLTPPVSPSPIYSTQNIFQDIAVLPEVNGKPLIVSMDDVPATLPSFIKCTKLLTPFGPALYYEAEAPTEKIIKFGISGYKSDFILDPEQIKKSLESGITNAWIVLPNVGRNEESIPSYTALLSALFQNPHAEAIRKTLNRSAPKLLETHSTGGQELVHISEIDPVFKTIKQDFKGVSMQSTYIECPLVRFPKLKEAFEELCRRYPDKTPPELPITRLYMTADGRNKKNLTYTAFEHVTFAQIQHLLSGGRIADAIIKNPESNIRKLDIPIALYASSRDRYSSSKKQKEVARNLGAAFHLTKSTSHTPWNDNSETLATYIEASHQMVQGTFKQWAPNNGFTYPVEAP